MSNQTSSVGIFLARLAKEQISFLKKRITQNELFNLHIKYLNRRRDDNFYFKRLYETIACSKRSFLEQKKRLKRQIESELAFYALKKYGNLEQELLLKALIDCTDSNLFFEYAESFFQKASKQENKGLDDYEFLAKVCFNIHFHPHKSRYYKSSPKRNTINYYEKGCEFQYKQHLLSELKTISEQLTIKGIFKNSASFQLLNLQECKGKVEQCEEPVFHLYMNLILLQERCLNSIKNTKRKLSYKELDDFWKQLKDDIDIPQIVGNKEIEKRLTKRRIADVDIQFLCSKLLQIISATYNLAGNSLDIKEYHSYLRLHLSILDFLDQLDLVLLQNKLSTASFLQILVNAAYLKEENWTYSFHQKYKRFLPEDTKEDASKLCKAYSFFYKKNFEKANAIIQTINPEADRYIKTYYRVLQLFVLYELDKNASIDSDLFPNRIKASREYIRNENVINEEKNLTFKQTVLIIKDLMKAHENVEFSHTDRHALEDRIRNTQHVYSRYWLYLKLKEIKIRKK